MFILITQRLNSILLSLGLSCLLSAGFVYSGVHAQESNTFEENTTLWTLKSLYAPPALLWKAFASVVFIHALLSLLHTPPILARIGVHSAAYAGVLVGLGVLFAGLGVWGVVS